MKHILILLSLILSSCIFVDDDECKRNSDCWEDEVCRGGVCEYVPPTPTKKPPGAITVGCNCSTTSYVPGTVRTNNSCESGQDIIQLCNYRCCDAYACYGWAWKAVCL